MKLVILESPYAGDIEANIEYARRCLRDCLRREESPIASHLLFTQPGVLNDNRPEERKLGIEAGLAWLSRADYSVFYTDRGWSNGMLATLHKSCVSRLDFRLRSLVGNVQVSTILDKNIEELVRSKIET